jgi:hypothetical protein
MKKLAKYKKKERLWEEEEITFFSINLYKM